jgi:hypothetical protein
MDNLIFNPSGGRNFPNIHKKSLSIVMNRKLKRRNPVENTYLYPNNFISRESTSEENEESTQE